MSNSNHYPFAFADLPRTPAGILAKAKVFRAGLTGNNLVQATTPTLAIFSQHVDELDTAQTKFGKTRTPADREDRDAKALVVAKDVGYLVDSVQVLADQQPTPAEAATLIVSVGFKVQKPSSFQKQTLAAKYTGISGQVLLVALAIKGAGAYFWEVSGDQKSWAVALETKTASATLTGLTPGQTLYFRFRALTSKGKGDYSQVVSLLVH